MTEGSTPGSGAERGDRAERGERSEGSQHAERVERVVDRADYDPAYDPSAPVLCEVCGAEMEYTASCKLRCRRCGYTRDCSDP